MGRGPFWDWAIGGWQMVRCEVVDEMGMCKGGFLRVQDLESGWGSVTLPVDDTRPSRCGYRRVWPALESLPAAI